MENDIKNSIGAPQAPPQRVVSPQKSVATTNVTPKKNGSSEPVDVVDVVQAESVPIHGKTGIDEDTGTVFYQKIKGDRIIVQIPTETEIKLAQEAKKIAEELLGNLLDETV